MNKGNRNANVNDTQPGRMECPFSRTAGIVSDQEWLSYRLRRALLEPARP